MELVTILKPLPSPPGIRLQTGPVQPRQEEYRGLSSSAQRLQRNLFTVPPARPRIRPTRRTTLRVHSFLGLSGLSAVCHAARRLPPLPSGCSRRGSVERRQTQLDQSVYVVPGPLGAPAVL